MADAETAVNNAFSRVASIESESTKHAISYDHLTQNAPVVHSKTENNETTVPKQAREFRRSDSDPTTPKTTRSRRSKQNHTKSTPVSIIDLTSDTSAFSARNVTTPIGGPLNQSDSMKTRIAEVRKMAEEVSAHHRKVKAPKNPDTLHVRSTHGPSDGLEAFTATSDARVDHGNPVIEPTHWPFAQGNVQQVDRSTEPASPQHYSYSHLNAHATPLAMLSNLVQEHERVLEDNEPDLNDLLRWESWALRQMLRRMAGLGKEDVQQMLSEQYEESLYREEARQAAQE